jgi:hypothetical protein
MNGIPTSYLTSMLPPDAQTSRIAARGGLSVHAHGFPADGREAHIETGSVPDCPLQDTTAHGIEAVLARPRPASPIERQPNATIHHN